MTAALVKPCSLRAVLRAALRAALRSASRANVLTMSWVMLATSTTLAGAQAQTPPTAPAQLPACGAGHTASAQLASGGVQAWWRAEPAPLRVGQAFALVVALCPAQAQLLRVDAHMPEHRHGMNYRPTLQPLGDGRWRVDGLLWHMPGRWDLVLETTLGDQKQRLTQTVLLR